MKSVEEIVLNFLNLPSNTPVDDDFGVENCTAWDSLAQVGLVVELEGVFNTSFDTDEVMNMDTIGGIKKVLKAKGVL